MTWYIIIPFLFLIIAFIIKMPIAWGMLIGSVVYFLAKGVDLGIVVNTANYGVYSSYILIAIPLFIFTANVMNSSTITDKIYRFANTLVGRFRGGAAYVNILGSLIFAGMTGSALADASGLGMIEINQMKKEGYDAPFSCALTATTAVIGPTFPPSIPCVVYAMISGASVGKLFMGGIIPALMLCISLGIYVWYISKKRKYPYGHKCTFKEFIKDTLGALPALFTPVILLIGIYTGIMTPTEAGAVAAVYTLLISIFVYKSLSKEQLKKIYIDTIKSTGSIFLIIAAAYCFSYIISLEQVAMSISLFLNSFHMSKNMFLLVTNILFIIFGALIDVNVTQLVFVPIFVPIASALGIDLVHFGIMLCLNMMIGLATPPFGMLLFITSGTTKTPLKDVIKEVMPMLIPMFITLFVVAYFPDIVMWLPNLLSN